MEQIIKYTKINSRKYLGNKYRLLPFIRNVVKSECGNFETFADVFAGTGAVLFDYTNETLIINDILYSNYLCHINNCQLIVYLFIDFVKADKNGYWVEFYFDDDRVNETVYGNVLELLIDIIWQSAHYRIMFDTRCGHEQ